MSIPLRVVVVGGGIGGMATAVALQQRGAQVTVFEQAPEIGDVGAGVFLTANAVRVLRTLGAENAVATTSVEAHGLSFAGLLDGKPMAEIPLGRVGEEQYGAPAYFVHRADLLAAIAEQFRGELRTGSRIVELKQSETQAVVVLETGEEVTADLVVGGDGIKSVVRSELFGSEDARFSGRLAWRALFPLERIAHLNLDPQVQHSWFGEGRGLVCYPLRQNSIYNVVGFVPADEVTRESWAISGDLDDLRASFSGAAPTPQGVIDAIDTAFVTGLYFRDPIDTWNVGRVVLIGDAAHPGLPTVGQGAAMAIEDAAALAAFLDNAPPEGLEEALNQFTQLRTKRTARIVETSRINAQILMNTDPEIARARDGRFRGLQNIDPLGYVQQGWIWDHDVVAEATNFSQTDSNTRVRPEARAAAAEWSSLLAAEARAGGWPGERAAYDAHWENRALAPESGQGETIGAGGTRALVVSDSEAEPGSPVVFYVHGGDFTFGTAAGALEPARALAARVSGRAVVPDYRLAPEHPFPAPLDDLLVVYEATRAAQPEGTGIILAGEGAGATLALLLALRLTKNNDEALRGVYVVSPITDLTGKGRTPRSTDSWRDLDKLAFSAASFLHHHRPDSTEVSLLHADLTGLPPVLLHYADDEVLAPDARSFAERARACGVAFTESAFADSVPSFILFPELPERESALNEFASFSAVLGEPTASAAR